MPADERFELRDDVAAMAGGQLCIEELLERGKPQLFETPRFGDRERLERDLGERLAAPEGEGLA
jgi:hypothetical protein